VTQRERGGGGEREREREREREIFQQSFFISIVLMIITRSPLSRPDFCENQRKGEKEGRKKKRVKAVGGGWFAIESRTRTCLLYLC
jgi:hypothetical protein